MSSRRSRWSCARGCEINGKIDNHSVRVCLCVCVFLQSVYKLHTVYIFCQCLCARQTRKRQPQQFCSIDRPLNGLLRRCRLCCCCCRSLIRMYKKFNNERRLAVYENIIIHISAVLTIYAVRIYIHTTDFDFIIINAQRQAINLLVG